MGSVDFSVFRTKLFWTYSVVISDSSNRGTYFSSQDVIMRNIADVDREIEFSQQSPYEIGFSGAKIPLSSAYLAFARMLKNSIPDFGNLTFHPTKPLPEIASSDYFSAQSWAKESYPAGFTGRNICNHCRLQSWTYKPAC